MAGDNAHDKSFRERKQVIKIAYTQISPCCFLKQYFQMRAPNAFGEQAGRAGEIVTKAAGPGVNQHMGAPPKGID